MWLNILQGTIEQGLVFSLLAMGVYLTFRILDFSDLTVEGSFPLGASVAAVLIINGMNP
ncbi:MAG TPA: ABC transporter permease, partial [Firmicutes bacterium]|nr:ABC transporter permease [Bacillota bacterium]